MSEQFANLAQSTVGTPYSPGAGHLILVSAANFPAVGTFSVTVVDKITLLPKLIFRVTSIAVNNLAGAAESADVACNVGDVVYGTILSAAAMAQIKTDVGGSVPNATILKGSGGVLGAQTATVATAFLNPFTSLLQGVAPASGGGTTNFLRADGAWADPPGSGGGSIYTPPTGFTLEDGFGGASMPTDANGLSLFVPNSGGNNVIYCQKALSNSTYTAVFGFSGSVFDSASAQVGVVLANALGGLITMRFRNDLPNVDIELWTAYNAPSASVAVNAWTFWGGVIIVKIINDGVHRTYYIGDPHLRVFQQFHQEVIGAFAETEAGFFGLGNNGDSVILDAFHYSQV